MCNLERQSEMYLRKVIELMHGVSLELFDCNGLQNVVDYQFQSPGGNGAVEITTYSDGRAAAWFSKLSMNDTIDCPSQRAWTVVVDLGTKLDRLIRRLPAVVAACDRHRVDRPEHLPRSERDADVQWLIAAGVKLYASTGSQPGTARVQMPPTIGFPSNEGLDLDLSRMFSDTKILTKLRKLREHPDVTERHLGIGVDWYSPGFDLIDNLLRKRGYVPRYIPPDDFAATHVWLCAGGWDVLTWTRANGWSWQSLPRPNRVDSI